MQIACGRTQLDLKVTERNKQAPPAMKHLYSKVGTHDLQRFAVPGSNNAQAHTLPRESSPVHGCIRYGEWHNVSFDVSLSNPEVRRRAQ